VTTEDDFHAALDADPHDWQTRLVFADWLQDRNDPRAEGYRALAVGRNRTDTTTNHGVTVAFHWWSRDWVLGKYPNYEHTWVPVSLPTDWFVLINKGTRNGPHRRDYTTRRGAEDAAALAFAKLPPARRAEILAAPPPVFDEPPSARKPKKARKRRR
jgi:uncharacterized protein (TIGR02996 family)